MVINDDKVNYSIIISTIFCAACSLQSLWNNTRCAAVVAAPFWLLAWNISGRNRNTHHFCTRLPHFVTLLPLQPHSQLISLSLLAYVGTDRLTHTHTSMLLICKTAIITGSPPAVMMLFVRTEGNSDLWLHSGLDLATLTLSCTDNFITHSVVWVC